MKVTNNTINDSLQYKIRDKNKFDSFAVSFISYDALKQKVVGRLLLKPAKSSTSIAQVSWVPDYASAQVP